MRPKLSRRLRYLLEAAIVYPLFGLAWLLPVSVASAVGACIGTLFYYLHGGTARARRNLRLVMPERAGEHEAIIKGAWQNMGRVLLEYPHLETLWRKGYVSVEAAARLQVDADKPYVFVGIHQANWEVGPLTAARHGWRLHAIYRPLNNYHIDPLLHWARRVAGQTLHPKSAEGGMALLRHVRAGGSAAMLVDQRLGDGITVPFFGQPALSPPMAALMAVKYNATIIPVQIVRERGAHQRVTVHASPSVPTEGTEAERVAALTTTLHKIFEDWIRQHPNQWLWMHDRWRGKKSI